MKQIVCLSHIPWRPRPNRTQQILTRLPDAQILFFEPPGRENSPDRQDGFQVRPNIVVCSLPAPPGMDPTLTRRRSQLRIAGQIQKIIDRFHFREPVLWCTSPEYSFLLERLAYGCLVYDCYREWDELPLEWESELAIAADVNFAASPGLAERLSPCSENIALLPNGANPQMFLRDGLEPPDSLKYLQKPILARVGDLTRDVELEPLIFAAQWRPTWTFLLIGRVNKKAAEVLSDLPNIVFAGAVPVVELPDYFAGCQVLFDLIRTRKRGSDILPSRIYEYLSTGKPVVTMVEQGLPEPYPDVIYPAYDPSDFLRGCQAALDERDPGICRQRLLYAQEASWAGRALEVSHILDSI